MRPLLKIIVNCDFADWPNGIDNRNEVRRGATSSENSRIMGQSAAGL